MYVELPYYGHDDGHDERSAIEKPAVALAGFTKTNLLNPGASETVTVEIDPYDFASYDCYDRNDNGFKGWELEHGDYTLSLRTDAHTVKTVTYNGTQTAAEFTFQVADEKGIQILLDPVTQKPVGNLFTGEDAVDTTPLDANDGDFVAEIPWLTRADFMDPSEFSANYKAREITPSAKISFEADAVKVRAQEWDKQTEDEFGEKVDTSEVIWGANNNKKLAENGIITDLGRELGANYDDERWKEVLDQVTLNEVVTLINGYYGSAAINSVGKPWLADYDGPAQIKGFNFAPRGTGYPTMVVVAGTWNPKLAYEFGKSYGDDMKAVGVMGVWGWAIDCHRTAWFGRNHESPSEDSMLAGTIIANAVKGLNTRGRYCFIKHFALYGYGGQNIWVTEQAFRENYLRAYRKAFVDGGALGAMTTYQGIGAENSETTVALLTGVLRREWDFKGAITTDYIGHRPYLDLIIRCGGNFGMGVTLGSVSDLVYNNPDNMTSRLQHRMKEIAHQVLYMWLHADYNERQYLANPDQDDTYISSTSINSWVWWKPFITSFDICVGTGMALWASLIIISVVMPKKKKKRAVGDNFGNADVGKKEGRS